MPPAKRKKKSSPRCVYMEGTRRCTRVGHGDPPLCAAHELVLEEEEYDELDLIDGVLEQVDEVIERAADGIRRFFDQRRIQVPPMPILRPSGNRRPQPPPENGNGHRRAAPPPEIKIPAEDPRLVLGFAPEARLTKDMIRERKRALAAVFHPDKPGGSVQAMQRVNAAADKLLKSLG